MNYLLFGGDLQPKNLVNPIGLLLDMEDENTTTFECIPVCSGPSEVQWTEEPFRRSHCPTEEILRLGKLTDDAQAVGK